MQLGQHLRVLPQGAFRTNIGESKMNTTKVVSIKILGHVFKPMTSDDWECFAGAEEGTVICHLKDDRNTVLLFDPESKVLSEVTCDNDGNASQVDWTPNCILGDWSPLTAKTR